MWSMGGWREGEDEVVDMEIDRGFLKNVKVVDLVDEDAIYSGEGVKSPLRRSQWISCATTVEVWGAP